MIIAFMGIYLLVLSQNGPTKLVVWIFGGQSTVPPLHSSLVQCVELLIILKAPSNVLKDKLRLFEVQISFSTPQIMCEKFFLRI